MAAVDAMRNDYGNAASLHRKGFVAEQIINNAKKEIACAIGCNEGEIYFTSGATESNNISIIGTALAKKRTANKVVVTGIEHASVMESAKHLESLGFEVSRIMPNKNGEFSPMDFYNAVDDKTALVSAMFVNNELGTRLPIFEIAKAVKRKNPKTLFHTDAVQGFMKIPVRLKNTAIDLLSASGHKIYAPKGVGLLYMKNGVRLSPILFGGGQQKGVRVGTENVPLIAAFGAAVGELSAKTSENHEHYTILYMHLVTILKSIPQVNINSFGDDIVSYILNISIEKIRSEIMLHYLEQFGIFVSSGSACSKGAKSHVLAAYNITDEKIDTAIRISFSKENTLEELDFFVEKLKDGINSLAKTKGFNNE